MNYRNFGKLNWRVSALGFGAMRLPIVGDDPGKIDEPEAVRMIRYAIDHGVNYVDTAYGYHRGNSEALVGRALQDGYREKVKLATKMPCWLVNSQEDMDKCLGEQLKRLNSSPDFYLLHGLNKERWEKLRAIDVTDWAEERIRKGKFKHLGFSFHDSFEAFRDIIDSYEGWTLCQILYNYVDQECQAGTRGLEYAASKGLAVVVMEPIAGGRLTLRPAKPVLDVLDKAEVKRTQAEWALMWVWNHPEVSLALSGMSSMQQVEENVSTAEKCYPNMLTERELDFIKQIALKYKDVGFIDCSDCKYCQPCPEGVDIPAIFSLVNEYYRNNMSNDIRIKYWQSITLEHQAKRCQKCGTCEELCPRRLPIRNHLRSAAFMFEQERPKPKT
jgi:hypothetical protein